MERPEVPLEQSQEEIFHHAHDAEEKWIMGVALTAALLAVIAAITALLAEHHANEAMLEQIQSSDKWNYYQAKGIKANLLVSKMELLTALGETVDAKDRGKLEKYRKEQEAIKEEAEEKERASEAHLQHHTLLSRGVTLFQVGIAVGAISVLTKRKRFWYASLVFGMAGAMMFIWGMMGG
jgi:LPS O-antigen subunit length determinant protein (WzzB/FepE family)